MGFCYLGIRSMPHHGPGLTCKKQQAPILRQYSALDFDSS